MASDARAAPTESETSSPGAAGSDPSTHSEEASGAQPPTVHEFLARVVSDPQARAAFVADPATALTDAGLGDLDTEQVGYACSLALDQAPADVVEAYRSALSGGLSHLGGLGRGALTSSANHSTEIVSMNAHHGHKPDFGHHGDVDKTFMAKDSFNVVNIHDNLSDNSVGGHELPNPAQGAGAVTGALNQGAHQLHDAATHAPGIGAAASHVVPEHLPSPEQAPAAVTGALSHGPEQLHDAAASLPAVGPVADHLPSNLPSPADAGHLPVVGDLAGQGPTGALGAPIESVADNVPGVGEVAGHMPLDGLHG